MKILVIYATAGAGHRKAAEALYEGLKRAGYENVVLADSLDYTHPWFKKSYSGFYTYLITHTPALWGFMFWVLDIVFLRLFVRIVRRIYNSLNAQALKHFLIRENFDYIFSTHFLANEVSASLKHCGKISSKIVSVVTDFDVHSIWLSLGIDHYTVASEFTRQRILRMGVDPQAVSVTGIPVHSKFVEPKNISQLRQKMDLMPSAFTVLVATGSFGIGPIEELIRILTDVQLIVICGHNQDLYDRLKNLAQAKVKVFGLVNNMDEMMAISDVMITKPGGLSISEALVCELPMIFFNAIPGQETNNILVLKNYGIGISGKQLSEIPLEIKRLQNSPAAFHESKKSIRALARPNAVRDIIALISK